MLHVIRNIQVQHPTEIYNWHDFQFQMHGVFHFCQKKRYVALLIIHCDIAWYIVE